MAFDRGVFEAVQSLTGNALLDQIMVFFAEYLIVLVPLVIVYLWFQDRKGKHDSVLTFAATLSGLIVAYGLGLFYSHQNPSVTYDTIVAAKPENAFPSHHTTTMLSATLPLFVRKRKQLGYAMIFAALLTGFARVYIGEHWPIDILGAAFASLAGVAVTYLGDSYVEYLNPVYKLSEKVEDKITQLF